MPPFLVGCRQLVPGGIQLAAGQIQHPAAAVFVFKDLPDQPYRDVHSLKPAGEGGVFWPVELVYPNVTVLLAVGLTQRDQSVALEGTDEILATTCLM